MGARERAEDVLVFYMAKAWEAAGLEWQGDNEAETRLIVENLADACTHEAGTRMDALCARVAALEDELSRVTGFTPALP